MKVFLRTFGCRANHYDSEVVRQTLEAAGAELVATPADADVAVFNSCAVTADAVADLRQAVRRAARENDAVRTVLMGCAAALEPHALATLPGVRAVVPGAEWGELLPALGLSSAQAPVRGAQAGTRATLRVQDGCDEHCTFCATTLARGRGRSRPLAELVAEATALAEVHPEIVLTGIHLGHWGRELGLDLGRLVEALVDGVEGARFRLSSVEASELDERLVALLRSGERVVPHLHAPLQSGSDRLLKRMGRHWYTAERYANAIERLAADRPVLGLGADVITGFPGETEEDHAATVALVERLPFTYLHVFPFSSRPGTAAERLPDHLPPAVVARRAGELRALGARKGAAYRSARVGGMAEVVVQGRGGTREGLTEDYLSVSLADPGLPRGARVTCRLELAGDRLQAVPVQELSR
ncbi:MAG TPA: MiaB/RimO family radical SAM methylthiotransferase [Gemmatimonadaceae bacterium]|nr:MiaB/RimO family radical SAM methylthiotransferase [Gemmatimonadaceae bacterium]